MGTWVDLPDPLFYKIVGLVPFSEIVTIAPSCKAIYNRVWRAPKLWNSVTFRETPFVLMKQLLQRVGKFAKNVDIVSHRTLTDGELIELLGFCPTLDHLGLYQNSLILLGALLNVTTGLPKRVTFQPIHWSNYNGWRELVRSGVYLTLRGIYLGDEEDILFDLHKRSVLFTLKNSGFANWDKISPSFVYRDFIVDNFFDLEGCLLLSRAGYNRWERVWTNILHTPSLITDWMEAMHRAVENNLSLIDIDLSLSKVNAYRSLISTFYRENENDVAYLLTNRLWTSTLSPKVVINLLIDTEREGYYLPQRVLDSLAFLDWNRWKEFNQSHFETLITASCYVSFEELAKRFTVESLPYKPREDAPLPLEFTNILNRLGHNFLDRELDIILESIAKGERDLIWPNWARADEIPIDWVTTQIRKSDLFAVFIIQALIKMGFTLWDLLGGRETLDYLVENDRILTLSQLENTSYTRWNEAKIQPSAKGVRENQASVQLRMTLFRLTGSAVSGYNNNTNNNNNNADAVDDDYWNESEGEEEEDEDEDEDSESEESDDTYDYSKVDNFDYLIDDSVTKNNNNNNNNGNVVNSTNATNENTATTITPPTPIPPVTSTPIPATAISAPTVTNSVNVNMNNSKINSNNGSSSSSNNNRNQVLSNSLVFDIFEIEKEDPLQKEKEDPLQKEKEKGRKELDFDDFFDLGKEEKFISNVSSGEEEEPSSKGISIKGWFFM
eukprot:TRINITY_DN3459_c2_g1_i2.p1 TRINITY_DN3459_c2_g1~~TRINITY_DN3459_c2_g1_i2.p1  ORF type:complete len:726 (+),score=137.29 TRINITY_DN3459_c2_g1_i2:323-2500(+)